MVLSFEAIQLLQWENESLREKPGLIKVISSVYFVLLMFQFWHCAFVRCLFDSGVSHKCLTLYQSYLAEMMFEAGELSLLKDARTRRNAFGPSPF